MDTALNGKLMGAFIALNLIDAVLTQVLLQTGLYHEGNIFIPTTPGKMILYKLVVPVAVVTGVSALARPPYATANNILKGLTVGIGAVVAWNAYNLSRVSNVA